jgi:hypothetical protein
MASKIVTTSKAITDDMIASRAYEKWEQRGCPEGEPEVDWFAARAELEQESGSGETRAKNAA